MINERFLSKGLLAFYGFLYSDVWRQKKMEKLKKSNKFAKKSICYMLLTLDVIDSLDRL